METVKFSILIAYYNNYEFFQDCYSSILAQTYNNLEIILLDDCSTDDSMLKIKDLTKNNCNFKVFKNSENKGVGYTKAKLIELATGEICGFLDPDDLLAPEAVAFSVNEYSDPNIVATYSQMYFCSDDLQTKKIANVNRKIKNRNPLFLNIFFEVNHFFTFKKSAYQKTEKIRGDLRIAEDQDLYLKLYEKGDFKFIQKPLYYYRRHSQGLSQDSSKEKLALKKEQWTSVLKSALLRRRLTNIYGKDLEQIPDLPEFIFQKQNTILKRLGRKFL